MAEVYPIESAKKRNDSSVFIQIPLPETGFLRLPQVLAHIPVCKAAWYSGIAEGRYPRPVKLSKRTAAWRVEDIRALIAELGQTGTGG